MSLTVRLTLTYLLITLAGVLLLSGGFVALAGRYMAEQRDRELGAQAELYAALLGELAAGPAALQAFAAAGSGAELLPPGTTARVFSAAGALLAGDPALGPFPSRAALPLVSPPVPLPASQVVGRHYAARLVGPADNPVGVLELSRSTAADDRLLADLRRLALQAALVAAAVVATVSLLVARSIARPIVTLTRRAEDLAATYTPADLAQAAPTERGADELKALTASLERLDGGLRAFAARIAELEQARARFYRSVSHELRTPLTAISAGLENLADIAPAEQRPALAALEGETVRLSRLVDELLRPPDDGHLALATRTPIDLAALVAEVRTLLQGRAARAGVSLEDTTTPVVVQGDHDRLKQALLNLADNGLRVTPPGGVLRITVEYAGKRALLAVVDGGPGVPAALRERIWERGVRGDDTVAAGSAGLGLAIVREIVLAHGGRAYLDEAHGPGARFVIELPGIARAAGQEVSYEHR